MPTARAPSETAWMKAKGLLPLHGADAGLHCALVPDDEARQDHIAVVYNRGEMPPEITVEHLSGDVHKVCANGEPVAIVASTNAPAPEAGDVLLVERYV